MIISAEHSTAICILGMHRSGTSTVTRAINLLGAYLGEDADLMPPLPENPEGFWERMDIWSLQDRILSVMERDWTTTTPLPENWHTADKMQPYKDELVELVIGTFGGKSLWAWKDPRTCLLLPLWKDVLAELGFEQKVVFVIRNPLDVARSLEKRNGFPLHIGLSMWFNYTLAALKGVEGLETVFVSYDCFLANWKTELKKCSEALGIDWPADDTELKEKMASFMRHDLRHSVSGLEELKAAKVSEPISCLYRRLIGIQSGTERVNDDTGYMPEKMYQELLQYAKMLDSKMDRLPDYHMTTDKSLYARSLNRLKSIRVRFT